MGHGAMAALRVVCVFCALVKKECGLVCTKRGAFEPVTAASRLGAAASLAVVLFGFSGDGRRNVRSERWSLGLRLKGFTALSFFPGQHTVVNNKVVELYGSLAITR